MAELHVVGEVHGSTGFGGRNVFCKWTLVNGPGWDVIEGLPQGQTHVDYPGDADDAVWSHPMDLHLACKTLSGWPKLSLEVWSLDGAGRADIAGYGFCHIPGAPGRHEISCPMWVPTGSDLGRFKSFFIGGNPRLKDGDVAHRPGERFLLQTEAAGMVHIHVNVIVKDFARNHIHVSVKSGSQAHDTVIRT